MYTKAIPYDDNVIPPTVEKFRKQREEYYLELLQKTSNVTLLHESIDGPFEHSFNRDCYQKEVKKLIKKYKDRDF